MIIAALCLIGGLAAGFLIGAFWVGLVRGDCESEWRGLQ